MGNQWVAPQARQSHPPHNGYTLHQASCPAPPPHTLVGWRYSIPRRALSVRRRARIMGCGAGCVGAFRLGSGGGLVLGGVGKVWGYLLGPLHAERAI